ncbi:UNVERIFIED_CONTAM: hypothetical protein K2H54_073128 [Gekko kuhli]
MLCLMAHWLQSTKALCQAVGLLQQLALTLPGKEQEGQLSPCMWPQQPQELPKCHYGPRKVVSELDEPAEDWNRRETADTARRSSSKDTPHHLPRKSVSESDESAEDWNGREIAECDMALFIKEYTTSLASSRV